MYNSDGEELDINQSGCRVTITNPRNIKHHRLVFAMLNYVLNHMKPRPFIKNTERLLQVFKDSYGYFESFEKSNGDIVKDYHSISFASMSEIDFKPVAEEIKQFCYAVLNMDKCDKNVMQGLIDIEF
jgi:hypothetical protein